MGRARFGMFTEQARMVIALAHEEALRLHARTIGTEHLLLGLLRLPDSSAMHILRELAVDTDELRAAVEFEAGSEAREGAPGRMRDTGIVVVRAGPAGMTRTARGAIALAVNEARRLKQPSVDAGHLLLGLLYQEDGIAATALARCGVTLERAAAHLPRDGDPSAESTSDARGGLKNNVVTCRLDDRALDALDVLVEAGIRPTRSDAAAWLISTGIEAHRALFERVNATVDEIRKLRLEAQAIAGHVGDCGAGAASDCLRGGPGERNTPGEGREPTQSRRTPRGSMRGE